MPSPFAGSGQFAVRVHVPIPGWLFPGGPPVGHDFGCDCDVGLVVVEVIDVAICDADRDRENEIVDDDRANGIGDDDRANGIGDDDRAKVIDVLVVHFVARSVSVLAMEIGCCSRA